MKKLKRLKLTGVKKSVFRNTINSFILLFAFFVFLFFLFITFSQTQTFRNYLREKVISIVNENVNGTFHIKEISGSILSSIFFENVTLVDINKDTVFFSKEISIKLSPHKIIFDVIYLRDFSLKDVYIFNKIDSLGNWSLGKVFKPSEDTTTTDADFPYIIDIDNIEINNLNFTNKTFNNLKSHNNYSVLNFEDLELKNFNLTANTILNISKNTYNLVLKRMDFKINSDVFQLNNFSGNFLISPEIINLSNVNIETDSSSINLNYACKNLDLFSEINIDSLATKEMVINSNSDKISFSDINFFIGALDFLKGNPSLDLVATGNLENMSIKKLKMDYLNTSLALSGSILNINKPSTMQISANLNNSKINYSDIQHLLPEIEFPQYDNLDLNNISIIYNGGYDKFNFDIKSEHKKGSFTLKGLFDFQKPISEYNFIYSTSSLDLSSLFNVPTNLNTSGTIKGAGFTPRTFNNSITMNLVNSKFDNYKIDSLRLSSKSFEKKFNISSYLVFENANYDILSIIDFKDSTLTKYKIKSEINNFNLANITKDTSIATNLNMNLFLEGENLDFNFAKADIKLDLFNSKINSNKLDSTSLNINLDFANKDNRSLILSSNIFNFELKGLFQPITISHFISSKSKIIIDKLFTKASELNPLGITKMYSSIEEEIFATKIIQDTVNINFKYAINDNNFINSIINSDKFELKTEGNGTLKNDQESFTLEINNLLKNLTYTKNDYSLYISNFDSYLDLSKNNDINKVDDLFASFQMDGKRLYTGIDINNFQADIIFNQNKLYYDFYTELENNIKIDVDGNISMQEFNQLINVSNLNINYNGTNWLNKNEIIINLLADKFEVKNFNLYHDSTKVLLDGFFDFTSKQDFIIKISNLNNKSLQSFSTIFKDPFLKYSMNIESEIKGYLYNPIIKTKLYTNSFNYKGISLGNINGNVNYSNKLLTSDLVVLRNLDSLNSALTIDAQFPIDLNFVSANERILYTDDIVIKMQTNNFNVSAINNFIPAISNISGIINSDLLIKGNYNKLNYSGNIGFIDNYFVLNFNNLRYKLNANLEFENEKGIFKDISLMNTGDARYQGEVNGGGFLNFKGFLLDELNIELEGSLAVLGQKTRISNPIFYGDLLVETLSPVIYNYKNSSSLLKGSILLKETDLVYTYKLDSNINNSDFVYNYVIDSTQIDNEELAFTNFLSETKKKFVESDATKTFISNFDFDLDIQIGNDARTVFVLSDMLNQKLFVEATGGLKMSKYNGVTRTQGIFTLLSGSTLEFYKKFDASGSLRFESDITNPFLDIAAIYQSDYFDSKTEKPEPVAVKTKIYGPLSDLNKILTQKSGNIKIYRGDSNIKNDIPDGRYDFSDAIIFLITNKFKDELNQSDQNLVQSQLTSSMTAIAGTVLSDYLNSSVGGLINNIQVSESSNRSIGYIYNLSGRYKGFKYSFGGATGQGVSIGKSNFRFEYMFNPNFSIRWEQRNPVGLNYDIQKINEIGLKYIVEF